METVRESVVGQILRAVTKNKVLRYAEEEPDFEVPEKYKPKNEEKKSRRRSGVANADQPHPPVRRSESGSTTDTAVGDEDNENAQQGNDEEEDDDHKDKIIVGWYGDDDQENPQNWSIVKKCWLTFCIMLMTVSVYMGSSIWSPGIMQGVEYFGLGQVTVTLGLSLFVAGYGIGPLFLSPITEIPAIGRSLPYVITLALFTILQVPTALATNFAGFAILRFLAGFVGSPPLATGGASLQDVFSPHKVPYAMGLYGLAAGSAPALAPIISGFAVEANGWRWAFWIMLMLSGFTLIVVIFGLPETSSQTILLNRAKRLRKLTGNNNITSESEIAQAKMTPYQVVQMSLLRPLSMTFTEPIVLACNLYIGLLYAILYSYFESFPIVYGMGGYGWSPAIANLPFASLLVGSIISYAGYSLWNAYYFEPRFVKEGESLKPEARLPMSMLGAFCFPICLFWFAWTSNRTSWVSPVIASSFFGLGITWMFLPFLTYLPTCYPEYAASVLASNDFFRSMMGAGMPLAAHGLFVNLGIDWGNTLLGCLTVLFIPVPFVLFKYGGWLRSKSPMALHDDDLEKKKEGRNEGEA